MKVGSLFSGIGGFDLGLERAGFEVAWQCDNSGERVTVFGVGDLSGAEEVVREPLKLVVQDFVPGASNNTQILGPIIGLVSVHVVNDFIRSQTAAQFLFGHHDVLGHVAVRTSGVRCENHHVAFAVNIATTLPRGIRLTLQAVLAQLREAPLAAVVVIQRLMAHAQRERNLSQALSGIYSGHDFGLGKRHLHGNILTGILP